MLVYHCFYPKVKLRRQRYLPSRHVKRQLRYIHTAFWATLPSDLTPHACCVCVCRSDCSAVKSTIFDLLNIGYKLHSSAIPQKYLASVPCLRLRRPLSGGRGETAFETSPAGRSACPTGCCRSSRHRPGQR